MEGLVMRTDKDSTRNKTLVLGALMLCSMGGLVQPVHGQAAPLPEEQVVKGVVRDFLRSHPDFDLRGSSPHIAGLIDVSTNGLNQPVLSGSGFVVEREWVDESGMPIAPNTYNSGTNLLANVLLVVRDPSSLSVEETTVWWQLETWGYAVRVMDDAAPRPEVDENVAWADAAYITMAINPNVLDARLIEATIGLINASSALRERIGFAQSNGSHKTDRVLVSNSDHYITGPFGNGPLTVFSSRQPVADTGLGRATSLANIQSAGPALEVYDAGERRWRMSPAPGRRVQLPWNDVTFDMSALNENGLTLFRRAIEWGAGANLRGCSDVSDGMGEYGAWSDGQIGSELTFSQWFRDAPGYNGSQVHAITLTLDGNGVYSFETQAFHPVDNDQFGNEGEAHNYNFTYEINATFTYHECAGQFIRLTSDDDAWIFIDGRLAVDLGGISSGVGQFVSIDRFGLTDGETYRMHLLHAQRQSASSRFAIQTNLLLSTPTPELQTSNGYD